MICPCHANAVVPGGDVTGEFVKIANTPLTNWPHHDDMVSESERISHVFRRLGYGAQPDLVSAAASTDEALATVLDLSAERDTSFSLEPPEDIEAAMDRGPTRALIAEWLRQLAAGPRRIEERLVWFWHDHFATDIRKVKVPYLMYIQHEFVREHAVGSFGDLLHGIATDPAMLVYLDGAQNRSEAINENFGREVMELFTLGRGNYTEDDVLAASRAFSGWILLRPGGRAAEVVEDDPWSSQFVPFRHDDGPKTLLGVTGPLDSTGAIDVLLDQERTAEFVGAKLFEHLVGLRPEPEAIARVARAFRREYEIMDLVTAIVEEEAFLSDTAILAKVRTPLEKAIGIAQAFGLDRESLGHLSEVLRTMGYVPMVPPNVAGFPDGESLLDPHRLVHTFDLSALVPRGVGALSSMEIMNRLGIFDVSADTMSVIDSVPGVGGRIALAINSPEHHLI